MKKILSIIGILIMSFIIVACDELPEEDVLQTAINSVQIGFAEGDSSTSVTQNITLPTTYSGGSVTFSWTSSEPSVISASGVVNRPVGESNISVTLYLTATYNGQEKEKTFYLTVIPISEQVTTYTVTFNSNGGSTVNTITVVEGAKINAPVPPTRAGYIFDAWYVNPGLTTAWDFANGTVTSNMVLYAKWNPDGLTYTVTFETNGGSPIGSVNVLQDGFVTKPANPTRDGFMFDAWYKDEDLTTPWLFATDKVTGNITLYAKW